MINNSKKLARQRCYLLSTFILVTSGSFLCFTYFRQREAPNLLSKTSLVELARTQVIKKGPQTTGKCELVMLQVFPRLMSNYRRCLLEQMDKKSKWNELAKATEACLGKTLWNTLDIRMLSNWDDVKQIIIPNKTNASDFNCVTVTLGVGNDIEAEKKLRKQIPNCRFYGADPIIASGKIFKEIGTYYEIAVGSKKGVMQASVLENGAYHHKNVSTVTFMDFVQNYAKVDHIDYLFMDNEGPEYELFPQFKPDGPIGRSNISICQISVEMHGPVQNYGTNETKVNDLLESTIRHTAFLPFWSSAGGHLRSYYLNVKDEYCLRTFYMDKFCTTN